MTGGLSGSLRKEIHFEPARDQSTNSVDRLARMLRSSSFITNHFLNNDSSKVVRNIYKIFLVLFKQIGRTEFIYERTCEFVHSSV